MSEYLEHIKIAVRKTDVLSPTSYSWFGQEGPKLSMRIQRAMTANTARRYLLHQLQTRLYNDFYIRGVASSAMWVEDGCAMDSNAFVEALSNANAGQGCWESGWEVVAPASGEIVVRKTGLTLWVRPEDCRAENGEPMRSGGMLCLHLPKELLSVSPGYYMALGARGDDSGGTRPLVRLYWNLRAECAEGFVRGATLALNEASLFFRLKVLNDPKAYTRCDAGVVYVYRDEYAAVARALRHVYREVAREMKPRTPMFTKAVAAGVGVAEDPRLAESFGQHRCRLLADGMIQAYERQARSFEQRLQVVLERYLMEGIELSRPYLEPASADIYTYSWLE
ncbi:MAG TPA: T3SS effector HopA1 family protein [Bryobacteraceae bacterium]|nr:T3SS effector HopA1 family protein [Bryobacteraceae bacterium]